MMQMKSSEVSRFLVFFSVETPLLGMFLERHGITVNFVASLIRKLSSVTFSFKKLYYIYLSSSYGRLRVWEKLLETLSFMFRKCCSVGKLSMSLCI